jgi:hypothetical protein
MSKGNPEKSEAMRKINLLWHAGVLMNISQP